VVRRKWEDKGTAYPSPVVLANLGTVPLSSGLMKFVVFNAASVSLDALRKSESDRLRCIGPN
jgi:hypothetical protein